MNIFVFDIETVPDIEGGRRIYGLDNLTDAEVAQALFNLRRQETGGSEFLRLHLQRIVAISVLLRTPERLKIWTLGDEQSPEAELVSRFFQGIDRYSPTLVSWNGGGFDLPVIHYRSMIHGVASPRYWEQGENDSSFRYNNYLNRYHHRHTDLMDVLALFQPRANVPLDEMAALLGFPGKMGMSGGKVWDAFQAGEIKRIRDYCETDVMNTYLVYARYQLIRGEISQRRYNEEMKYVRETLKNENKPHWDQFLSAWVEPPVE